MDDRNPKHKLEQEEKNGLTYIVPTAFFPKFTDYQKRHILFIALEALDREGVLSDTEYLNSGFCNRSIPYSHVKQYSVKGFPSLYKYVWDTVMEVRPPNNPWIPDTITLQTQTKIFLHNI